MNIKKRAEQWQNIKTHVIKLSGGAAAAGTRACLDAPQRCYGEKCFSAFCITRRDRVTLDSGENAKATRD